MSAEPVVQYEQTEIGVYEAKTHLSQLLDLVADGKVVFITRHGKRAAELRPVTGVEQAPRRPFGGWETYALPDGWDDFTAQDATDWYGE